VSTDGRLSSSPLPAYVGMTKSHLCGLQWLNNVSMRTFLAASIHVSNGVVKLNSFLSSVDFHLLQIVTRLPEDRYRVRRGCVRWVDLNFHLHQV